MKKELDWEEAGKLNARYLSLFTMIRNVFFEMKVGLEIIAWLLGEGREIFVEKFLKPLGRQYRLSKKTGPPVGFKKPPCGKFFGTVTLGICKTAEDFKTAIELGNKGIVGEAMNILEEYLVEQKNETELDLYEISIRDLKINDSHAKRKDIYNCAFRKGFKLCPIEVAPLACIKSSSEEIVISTTLMNITKPDSGQLLTLHFDINNKLYLCNMNDFSALTYHSDYKWLFVWPRKKIKN